MSVSGKSSQRAYKFSISIYIPYPHSCDYLDLAYSNHSDTIIRNPIT